MRWVAFYEYYSTLFITWALAHTDTVWFGSMNVFLIWNPIFAIQQNHNKDYGFLVKNQNGRKWASVYVIVAVIILSWPIRFVIFCVKFEIYRYTFASTYCINITLNIIAMCWQYWVNHRVWFPQLHCISRQCSKITVLCTLQHRCCLRITMNQTETSRRRQKCWVAGDVRTVRKK